MKKILYSFLLFAVALVSTAALVSCGGDDEEDDVPQTSQASLDFKVWMTEDLQKIADVKTTGISQLSCTKKATLEYYENGEKQTSEGYESQTIHFEGQQAEEAKFKVSVQLKPNWKELIGDKQKLDCRFAGRYIYTKGTAQRSNYKEGPGGSSSFNVSKIMADKENQEIFEELINKMSYSYPPAKL